MPPDGTAQKRPAAGDGGCGRGRGTREYRSRADALAALEIAIARADAELARAGDVAVHAEAHRAARLAPFGAGGRQDLVEATRLGLGLDLLGPGHDEHAHPIGNAAPFEQACSLLDIREASVGAAADEHDVDGLAGHRFPGLDPHVLERLAKAGVAVRGHGFVKDLIEFDFPGPIYPVNPKLDELMGQKAYPRLEAIPGPVDFVISAVPARPRAYSTAVTRSAWRAWAFVTWVILVTAIYFAMMLGFL